MFLGTAENQNLKFSQANTQLLEQLTPITLLERDLQRELLLTGTLVHRLDSTPKVKLVSLLPERMMFSRKLRRRSMSELSMDLKRLSCIP